MTVRELFQKINEARQINFCDIDFNIKDTDKIVVYDSKNYDRKKELEAYVGSLPKLLEETDVAVMDETFKEYQVWRLDRDNETYTIEIYMTAPDHIEKPANMKMSAN